MSCTIKRRGLGRQFCQSALILGLVGMASGALAQNWAQTFQMGTNNTAETFQSGASSAMTIQRGDGNGATVMQSGDRNISAVMQSGSNHETSVTQIGDLNIDAVTQVTTRLGSFSETRTRSAGGISGSFTFEAD